MRLVLGLIVAVFASSIVKTTPTDTCPPGTLEDAKKSDSPLTDFAINFYKKVSANTQDKNAVMSPVSVALALALLESGANGGTRDKIKSLLAGSGSNVDVLASYRALQKQLNISEEKTKLSIANGMFPQKNFELKPDYVTTIRDCFESEIENVDFQSQLEQSRQKINKWVSDKTSNKIPELFKTGVLSSDVVLVLANAIYFKSAWNSPFPNANTKQGTFYKFGREQDQQTVQFMKQTALFGYASDANAEIVEMTYNNRDLSMYILLPKAKDGLVAFEQQLTGEKLKTLLASVQTKYIDLDLPKFTVRSPVDLKDILSKMDLGVIFSNGADFGRMSATALKVSKAVHEAYINVNENGTEAAAATGFSMTPRSGRPRNPQQVTVNHPFLYAIKHKPTGSIIFLGKINFVEEN